jgi:hypothetical protein
MNKTTEALKLAEEALDKARWSQTNTKYVHADYDKSMEALAAIREALAEPVQEPVAWTRKRFGEDREYCESPFTTDWTPLYAAPVQPVQQEPVKQEPVKEEPVALNIAAQCRATASDAIAANIIVDAGSGTLRELLLDAAQALENAAPAQPVKQEPIGRWNWNEAKFEWLTKFDYHKHHMTPLYAAPVQPVKQEPVAIGNEWKPCMKLPIVVHVREQREGETHVSTREGITPILPTDLIMRGVAGEEYPIGYELFNKTYTFEIAAPVSAKAIRADAYKNWNPDVTFNEDGTFSLELPDGDEIRIIPPEREWVDLTDDEIDTAINEDCEEEDVMWWRANYCRAVIAAFKEKNK